MLRFTYAECYIQALHAEWGNRGKSFNLRFKTFLFSTVFQINLNFLVSAPIKKLTYLKYFKVYYSTVIMLSAIYAKCQIFRALLSSIVPNFAIMVVILLNFL